MSASKRFVWPSCVHRFNGKSVGAYRIRPSWRRCCMFDGGILFIVIVPFSLTWGRMRYAPTPVRLISGIDWVGGWFRFRPREGVCDTPLHLFDWKHCFVGWCVGFVFAHMRAYAIRPYTCSVKNDALLVGVLVSFSPTSGRMRYAPTLVRLKSGFDWLKIQS